MTREEAIDIIKCLAWHTRPDEEDVEQAIKVLEQQPCDDYISRQEVINCVTSNEFRYKIVEDIKALPSVTPKEKTGHCKDCKHFEYDHIENVSGIPLIVAHEICSRWGDGCKTKEDGYCFLFESQESEDKE